MSNSPKGCFELPLRLPLGPVVKVKVVRGKLDEPLDALRRDGSHKVARGENKILKDDPCRLAVEDRGRMDGHDLVILGREVVTLPLQVRHLHKETRCKALADVVVVVLAAEVAGDDW